MYTLGFDVHKQNSQVTVIDEDGEPVEEVRVTNRNREQLAQQYVGVKPQWKPSATTSRSTTLSPNTSKSLSGILAKPRPPVQPR